MDRPEYEPPQKPLTSKGSIALKYNGKLALRFLGVCMLVEIITEYFRFPIINRMINADYFKQTKEMERKKMLLQYNLVTATRMNPQEMIRRRERTTAEEVPGDYLEPGVYF